MPKNLDLKVSEIISIQPWDDWLVTHFINKSEWAHEVVVREVLGAYWRVLRINSHLARFCFMKSIYSFLHFLASSLSNRIACRTIPFYISEKAAHSPTTYFPGTFQVQYRKCSDKWANALWPRYRIDVTSLLVPSLSTALFLCSIWWKTAYFGGFCRLIKTKRNMEYDLFLRKAS